MNISDRLNELMLSYRREARKCLRGEGLPCGDGDAGSFARSEIAVSVRHAIAQIFTFLYSSSAVSSLRRS